MKPLSSYPEDRARMLELIGRMNDSWPDVGPFAYPSDFERAASELIDLVKAILEDEAVADDAA